MSFLCAGVASADVAFKAALEQMQSKIADVIGDVLARFDGDMLMHQLWHAQLQITCWL